VALTNEIARAEDRNTGGQLVLKSLEDVRDALQAGFVAEWRALTDLDDTSTLFQSPDWVLPWYESYEDFEPRVLAVVRDGLLAGVVPLAVERATGRLTFGGDGMSDYRDVVARPGYRHVVVTEFLRFYSAQTTAPDGLVFGPMLPESETTKLLRSLCSVYGVRTIVRWNNGWRWWTNVESEDPLKKKSVRYAANYFRRQGTLEARYVRDPAEWDAIKDEFYLQHSMRQIFGGREVSLDNPQKRAFFDRLVRSPLGHVTTLHWNGQLIAAHVGSVLKGVLYWGAPSFDIRQRQYSPNLVLLALTMHNAAEWGFPAGVDLTMGKGEVKERFSNSRVEVPLVDLYRRPSSYFVRRARAAVIRAARSMYEKAAGTGAWEKRVRPVGETFAEEVRHIREIGIGAAAGRAAGRLAGLIGEHRRGIVFTARPEDLHEIQPQLKPGEICTHHENGLYDLLKREQRGDDAAREISRLAANFNDLQRTGRTLHTLLVDDRLVAWGCSYLPKEPAILTEVGRARLEFAPNSASLYAFYTLPEFRGRRLYQLLLLYILKKRFAEGVSQCYISVLENNVPSRRAIEQVGFRPVALNELKRFLKWSKLTTRNV
jgi:CelD/BcsL family acetyltransferase involved in cellulose biosynthesis/GNAT superfamily N-acetyltransferase